MNTTEHIRVQYRKAILSRILFILALVVCGAVLAMLGLRTGPMKFSVSDIVRSLMNVLFQSGYAVPEAAMTVITRIRLPRIILALLAGFGLAVSGMQMQVILRNPLASPFTLGVSAGAALGAGVAIVTGFTVAGGRYMLIGNAFVFALIPAAVIFMLSGIRQTSYGMLILAGIAMNFIFSSVSTLLSYFSNSEELKSLSLWMMGNLGRGTWRDITPLLVVFALTVPILFLQNQKLNILNSGDESAKGLGVNVERTRIIVLLVSSLVSAAVICFTGIIGFVGLVSPHIVRLIIGNDARYLMPASGLFGAVFLLGADIIAIRIIEPAVLPVGIVTSFIGGPVLLYLIVKKQRNRAW
jgi:iron complex transport system permease protein